MSFTGRLGTSDSGPGSLQLGVDNFGDPLEQLVEQTIEFVDSATANSHDAPASNALALASVATCTVHRAAAASNALTFMQTASGLHEVLGTASLSISFVDEATFVRHINQVASNALAFAQDTHANIINVAASNALAFVGLAEGRVTPIRATVLQSLNLVQSAESHMSVINKSVGQVLAFTDMVGRILTASVSQSISFTQVGERKHVITQSLGLSQLATVGKGGNVEQTLALVQAVICNGIFRRTVAQALGLQQSVTYRVERDCTPRQYSVFVGSSTDTGFTAPSVTPPTLSRTRLTLTYPYVTPTTTLELRNPEFGDKDRLNFNRINRETRGGTLVVFADPKWPKNQTLVLQVDNLSQVEADDMLDFIAESLGKEIGLLDWESRQWRGIITTPDAQITHVGKHDRSVAFEFQGVLA